MIAPTMSEADRQGDPFDQEGRAGRRRRGGARLAPASARVSPKTLGSSAALIESVLMAKARAAGPPPFSKRGT